nr:reverse transcriptase domain-containing protein [Tanacetum cinerariifolium]
MLRKSSYFFEESVEKSWGKNRLMKAVRSSSHVLIIPSLSPSSHVFASSVSDKGNIIRRTTSFLADCFFDLLELFYFIDDVFDSEYVQVQPVKQKLSKPKASGKLAKYAVELRAYNIAYMPYNAVKGQVLTDFLNEVPVGTKHLKICSLTRDENPKEWTLFSNRASSLKGAGARLVLIDPAGVEYIYAIWLNFASTNNETEYEALLARLRITEKMKVQALKVKVDSKLVACQMNDEFVANNDGMAKYLDKVKELSTWFKRFLFTNVPRNLNQKANVLSKVASVAFKHLTKEILVEVLSAKSVEVHEMNAIVEEEEDNWMTSIIKCLEEGIWLKDENWGRDILGPLPEGPGKIKFIIVAIDYFTKWMEAKPLAKITGKKVKKFIWENIVCRFGLPRNEAQNEEEMRLNLDLVQERRETTEIREAKYKKKVEQFYNIRVRPMSLKVRDFVYHRNEASQVENQGKLGANWEEPYRVVEAYENGSYKLCTINDQEVPRTWHAINLVRIKKLMLKIRSPHVVNVSS